MNNNISKDFKSRLIFGKYSLKHLIEKGTYGDVYVGKNVTDNKNYALKIERIIKGESILKKEAYILLYLKGPGIPSVISFGQCGKYHILVENLLGESIYNIWRRKRKKLNLKDLCMFAIQALERVEYVHSKNYLHRDIKPANFLVGKPDNSQIYLIDFGNSRKYRSSRTGKHLPFAKNYKIYGTAIFLSVNVLKNIEQTRKDELESLGLVIIYLYQGFLPWSDLKVKTISQALDLIKNIKMKVSIEELCADLPREFYEYMNYVKNMNFDDKPDYIYLQTLFLNLLKKIGEKNDLMFSWVDRKITPRRINNRNKNKSLQNLFNKVLHASSSKMISNSNNMPTNIRTLDIHSENKNIKRNDIGQLSKDKIIPFSYSKDNEIKYIYPKNNTEKKVKENSKNILINLNFNNKGKIYKIINNNNNYINKTETYLDNQKFKIIKLNKRKENYNLEPINSNIKIKIQNSAKWGNTTDINFNLNPNFNNYTKVDNIKNNNIEIKKNENFKFKKLPLSINNSDKIFNNPKIISFRKFKNIYRSKMQGKCNSYVIYHKKADDTKLNVIRNNRINQTKINNILEDIRKPLYTEEENKKNKSQKSFNFQFKPIFYKSIFTFQSDYKDIPEITKKLIKGKQESSQKIPKKILERKIKPKLQINTERRNLETENINLKYNLNNKKKIYKSPLYKNTSFTYNNLRLYSSPFDLKNK